jgi:predicted RND superfamily exporter protein
MTSINNVSGNGINKGIFTEGVAFTWMRTEEEFINSAVQGILISMSFTFLVLILSTMKIGIAIYSAISVSCIVLSVTCIMQLLGWEFEISSSVAVVVLIGFSVDYVVHLANHYGEAAYNGRRQRTKHVLEEIGISIFSGTITTLLSGLPLYACTVDVF